MASEPAARPARPPSMMSPDLCPPLHHLDPLLSPTCAHPSCRLYTASINMPTFLLHCVHQHSRHSRRHYKADAVLSAFPIPLPSRRLCGPLSQAVWWLGRARITLSLSPMDTASSTLSSIEVSLLADLRLRLTSIGLVIDCDVCGNAVALTFCQTDRNGNAGKPMAMVSSRSIIHAANLHR